MSQTTYNIQPNTGSPGLPAYANDMETKVFTYSNVSQVINFGVGVSKVPGFDNRAALPTSGSKPIGITVRDLQQITGQYPLNSAMAVMAFGQVWVSPEVAVSADDSVYMRIDGRNQTQTLTASIPFTAGNTFNATVTVNGNATVLSVPFNTTNAQMLTDIAAAIAANTGVGSATSDGTSVITVIGSLHGVNVVFTGVSVTGGATQPTITVLTTVVGIPDTDRGRFGNVADNGRCIRIEGMRWITSTASYPNNTELLAVIDIYVPYLTT